MSNSPSPTRLAKKTYRYPAVLMYGEDVDAMRVIMKYWKRRMGPKYSFADVMRRLSRHEADHIRSSGESIIAV